MKRTPKRGPIHAEKGALAFKYRDAFDLLTACNGKTPKGEKRGIFTATLYLMPHTSGGGLTLCPYSTPDCRTMCLAGAGLSGLPRALGAKNRRTRMFLDQRDSFMQLLLADIEHLQDIAEREGVTPALRLNGSSDVTWERLVPGWADLDLQRYDYTKIPIEHRQPSAGYDLTFSIEGPRDMARAAGYLRRGQKVAAVVPEDLKLRAVARGAFEGFPVIDGDESDARFLDAPGSIILLKPKGHVRTGLMRPNLFLELGLALRAAA